MDIDLTHPEILTIEQLKMFVGSEEINDRYELIRLFYKYVAPLPQRKFRSNRWGLMLTESQEHIRGEKTSNESSSHQEKHESDRGIYTIIRQNSSNKTTTPIKLKRPSSSVISDDPSKRSKPDS